MLALGRVPTDEIDRVRWWHAVAAREAFERAVALDPGDLRNAFALASLRLQARGAVHLSAPDAVPPAFREDPSAVIGDYVAAAAATEGWAPPREGCWGCDRLWTEGASVVVGLLGLARTGEVVDVGGLPADLQALVDDTRAWLDGLWLWERWSLAGLLHRAHHGEIDIHDRAISPIVLARDSDATLADLVDDTAVVPFDLDGDGAVEVGGWVRPDAGLLVWDPGRTGAVRSGEQLFGHATWGLVFDHGYEALAALDVDRDGRLAGAELHGVRVWFDRGADGISGPDEVVDLDALGVTALRTDGVLGEDGVWAHPRGLETSTGTRPTWDWVARRWTP